MVDGLNEADKMGLCRYDEAIRISMPLMCSSNPGGDPNAAHCRPLLHINM